ncbi:hypothetical protein ACLOJK_027323 [Asimina triloba]
MAFDFLLGGRFAINNHQNFDISTPHYFMVGPTTHTQRVYKRKTSPTSVIPQSVILVLTLDNTEVINFAKDSIIVVFHTRTHQSQTLKTIPTRTSRIKGSLAFPTWSSGR